MAFEYPPPPYDFPLDAKGTLSYLGGVLSSFGSGIYNTNLIGLGVRVYIGSSGSTYANPGTVYDAALQGHGRTSYYSKPVRFQFIKTATNFSGGTLSPGSVGIQSLQYNTESDYLNIALIEIWSANISITSCTVTTPNVNIALGSVSSSSFTSVGTVVGTKAFNVGLNCGSVPSKVYVRLNATANTETSNTSVIALTGAGVAKGVGVQILWNSTPLDINTNILAGTSVVGIQNFSFQARYYQTCTAYYPRMVRWL